MRSCRKGSTLVELLVVIGLLVVLISLLLPVLARVREQAQRTRCAANLRQLVAAVHLYSIDNDGLLPSGARDNDPDEHCIWISHAGYQALMKYAGTQPQYTSRPAQGTVGDPILRCPNLPEPNELPVMSNLGWVLGYNYLAGHPKVMAARGWRSPMRNIDDGKLPVIADLNDWAPGYWTITPHQVRGGGGFFYDYVGLPVAQRQAAGGNVGYLDGSVQWRPISDMKVYSTYSNGTGSDFVGMW